MAKGLDKGRGHALDRCYRLAAALAAGETLDRERVATMLGIKPANADRHLRAIRRQMKPEVSTGRGGITSVRASRRKQIAPATVAAACFGASLARLFHGTPFEQRLREVVAHVLEGVRDVPKFEEHERQFLFITRGGERALRGDRGARLSEVVDAILDRKVIRVCYKRFGGESERVYIKPLSLALHQHQLYLLGRTTEGRLENIRFARITAVHTTKDVFEYPSLSDYDPWAWFHSSIGIFIHDRDEKGISVQKVKIRLDRRWASYVETHRWHDSQKHIVDDDGVVLELTVRTCPELEALILGFGPEAEVLQPITLREKIMKRVEEMAVRYGRMHAKSSIRTSRSRGSRPR